MSIQPKCQAAVPAKCRYHGVDSVAHTKVLLQKLQVATETYKALKNHAEAYAAYEVLRDAQKDYYATNQGMEEIETLLASETITSVQREQIAAVHKSAIDTRLTYEKTITAESAFIPATPKPFKSLPPAQLTGAETPTDIQNISMFRFDGRLVSIDFAPERKMVLASSPTSPDESELIGRASSVEEAERIATQWYNRNYNR